MRSALPLYFGLALWFSLTTALTPSNIADLDSITARTPSVERALSEIENSGSLDLKEARDLLTEHPELLQLFEGEGTTAVSARADNPNPGLDRSLWVTVSPNCVRLRALNSETNVN